MRDIVDPGTIGDLVLVLEELKFLLHPLHVVLVVTSLVLHFSGDFRSLFIEACTIVDQVNDALIHLLDLVLLAQPTPEGPERIEGREDHTSQDRHDDREVHGTSGHADDGSGREAHANTSGDEEDAHNRRGDESKDEDGRDKLTHVNLPFE